MRQRLVRGAKYSRRLDPREPRENFSHPNKRWLTVIAFIFAWTTKKVLNCLNVNVQFYYNDL